MTNFTFLIIVLVALIAGIGVITFVDFKLTDEQYNRLKAIVIKWPAILTLLGVIVKTFNVPLGEETVTLVAAIGAFLAYVLDISTKVYDAKNGEGEHHDF